MPASNIEIERKYLLSAVPPEASRHPCALLDQGYVPGDQLRERVRRVRDGSGERYVRTMKLGKGVIRQEFEEETTREIFEALWSVTFGKRLQKRRYFVPAGALTWEVDEFTDRQLVLAEVEIPAADFPIAFPEWLAGYVVREVTDESGFGNHELAR